MESMDMNGMNFTGTGALMDMDEMIELRKKKGQCITCGTQTHTKKMFKLHALTIQGEVFEGRCLRCQPMDPSSGAAGGGTSSNRSLSSARHVQASARPTSGSVSAAQSYRGDSQRGPMGPMSGLANVPEGAGSVGSGAVYDGSSGRRLMPSAYSHSSSSTRKQRRQSPVPPPSTGAGRHSQFHESGPIGTGHKYVSSTSASVTSPGGGGSGSGVGSGPSGLDREREWERERERERLHQSERSLDRGGELYSRERKVRVSQQRLHQSLQGHGLTMNRRDEWGDNFSARENSSRSLGDVPHPKHREQGESSASIFDDTHVGTQRRNRPAYDRDLSRDSVKSELSDHSGGSQFSGLSDWEQQRQHGTAKRRNSLNGSLRRGSGASQYSFESSEYEDHHGYYEDNRKAATSYEDSTRKMSHSHGRRRSSNKVDRTGKFDFDDVYEDREVKKTPKKSSSENHQAASSYDGHEEKSQGPQSKGTAAAPAASAGEEQKGALTNEAVQIIRQSSSCEDIILFMIENHADATILTEACDRLSGLDATEARCADMVQHGGFRYLLDGMKNHRDNASLQQKACAALANLCGGTPQRLDVAGGGGIECVVAAMQDHAENSSVQEQGCAALAVLSESSELHCSIRDAKGIDVVVKAMTAHSLEANLIDRAMRAVANLASKDKSVRKSISSNGGIDAVCISMVMHPTSASVQEQGCRSLRHLCSSDECRVSAEGAGGIDAIIGAMQIHRGEVPVQREGCLVLSTLAANANNKQVIGQSHGIDVIVRSMWVHSDDAELQEVACRALWTLSVDPENKGLIVEAGGIASIVSAMQGHPDVSSVQERACGCLANLAANSDKNKEAIVVGEGIDAIVMAMVLHPEEKLVQERACNALRKLAFEPHLDALRAACVVPLLQQAAQKFPGNCQEKAEQVLGVL